MTDVDGEHPVDVCHRLVRVAVDLATATGVAIVHHAACFLPITLLGLACIPLLGFSLHTVQAPPADEEERA